jgi:hypothetical protein
MGKNLKIPEFMENEVSEMTRNRADLALEDTNEKRHADMKSISNEPQGDRKATDCWGGLEHVSERGQMGAGPFLSHRPCSTVPSPRPLPADRMPGPGRCASELGHPKKAPTHRLNH